MRFGSMLYFGDRTVLGHLIHRALLWIVAVFLIASKTYAMDREDAVAFLKTAVRELTETVHTYEYEAVSQWEEVGEPIQSWRRVKVSGDCYCVYTAYIKTPSIMLDPQQWQLTPDMELPEQYFSQGILGNSEYHAKFVDPRSFVSGSVPTVDLVDDGRVTEPTEQRAMLGRYYVVMPVLDFLEKSDTTVKRLVDVVENGRPAKGILAVGTVSWHPWTTFEWRFDAATGKCLYQSASTSAGSKRNRREMIVTYAKEDDNLGHPTKLTEHRSIPKLNIYTVVRGCTTESTMEDGECFLEFHGFTKPSMENNESLRPWLIWANLGIVLLLIGMVLKRRAAN